jgi:hypothetical protein
MKQTTAKPLPGCAAREQKDKPRGVVCSRSMLEIKITYGNAAHNTESSSCTPIMVSKMTWRVNSTAAAALAGSGLWCLKGAPGLSWRRVLGKHCPHWPSQSKQEPTAALKAPRSGCRATPPPSIHPSLPPAALAPLRETPHRNTTLVQGLACCCAWLLVVRRIKSKVLSRAGTCYGQSCN